MQVPSAGPQATELESERMSHIRTQRALHTERIMASQAILQLLSHEETALGDAIQQRVIEAAEKARAQVARVVDPIVEAVEGLVEAVPAGEAPTH